jgi:uncharacterized protein (UPF0335 family)
MTKATPATIAADHPAADLIRSFVDRLVVLYRERKEINRHIQDNLRGGRSTEILLKELQAVSADIRDVLVEAARLGFTPKAVEIVAKQSMETPVQRRRREELALIVDLYREAISLKNDHGRG